MGFPKLIHQHPQRDAVFRSLHLVELNRSLPSITISIICHISSTRLPSSTQARILVDSLGHRRGTLSRTLGQKDPVPMLRRGWFARRRRRQRQNRLCQVVLYSSVRRFPFVDDCFFAMADGQRRSLHQLSYLKVGPARFPPPGPTLSHQPTCGLVRVSANT